MTKMKLALVGIGTVARTNYIPFLAKQPDVELGYFNRTPEKAAEAARQFGGTAFSSLEELAKWEPTSVFVLTLETARHEYATQLLDLGIKRMFLEKPLVAAKGQAHVTEEDFEQGKALLARADTLGCETAIVFNYRFFDQTLAAKELAEQRGLGKVINAVGLVHYACWSHCLDLIRHFAGNVSEITALTSPSLQRAPEVNIEAADVTAAFVMENGATGTVIGTAGMKWQQPLYELVLTFENGRIHMRDLDGTLELLDGKGQLHETRTFVANGSRWGQYDASFGKSVAAYLESLRHKTAPPIPAIEGLYELQFEAALKRSIAQKRPVQVQQEFPVK